MIAQILGIVKATPSGRSGVTMPNRVAAEGMKENPGGLVNATPSRISSQTDFADKAMQQQKLGAVYVVHLNGICIDMANLCAPEALT